MKAFFTNCAVPLNFLSDFLRRFLIFFLIRRPKLSVYPCSMTQTHMVNTKCDRSRKVVTTRQLRQRL